MENTSWQKVKVLTSTQNVREVRQLDTSDAERSSQEATVFQTDLGPIAKEEQGGGKGPEDAESKVTNQLYKEDPPVEHLARARNPGRPPGSKWVVNSPTPSRYH